MLAFAWAWDGAPDQPTDGLARRLAASLCAGIGGAAQPVEIAGLHFAYRPVRLRQPAGRRWQPHRHADGQLTAFHGYIDNASALAAEFGLPEDDLAALYAEAVGRWGDDADKKVIGEYCAIGADPVHRHLRLVRSPLRAPPLEYHTGEGLVAAASVARAIHATGLREAINYTKLADCALYNFSDQEATWYEGIARVPLGAVVTLEPGRPRVLRRYYDILALPEVRLANDEDYLARASELLDEGVRAVLRGFNRPGATLSGGLDSPQVAVRALRALPQGQPLPTFTFHPEAGWDGITENGTTGDERAAVEALAALHPGLEPHFTANEGYGHDHRWRDMVHAIGGAPQGMTNTYVLHGIWSLAAQQRCDVLLLAEWGNLTFSDNGHWAYVEYFRKGRWRQLWRALRFAPFDPRSPLRRFVALCLVPFLPDALWRLLMKLWHPGQRSSLDLTCPLTPAWRKVSGADRRTRAAGYCFGRYQPRSRRHASALTFDQADSETCEAYQAFEQLYGVPQRDPMAYRPFVEFCLGLPVDLLFRDGMPRWFAREMGRGIMPDAQRLNRRNGRWDADWHLRIGRQRDAWLAELDRIAADEKLAAMIDVPRLRRALEDFPPQTATDRQVYFPLEFAVPRGILTARFVNFVERRNMA